jgi:hypothetical protein
MFSAAQNKLRRRFVHRPSGAIVSQPSMAATWRSANLVRSPQDLLAVPSEEPIPSRQRAVRKKHELISSAELGLVGPYAVLG